MQYIAFDARKHYTWALVQDEKGKVMAEQRYEIRFYYFKDSA